MSKRLFYEGHTFYNEQSLRVYRGLKSVYSEGKINYLEVNPEFDLVVNDKLVCVYSPSFVFKDVVRDKMRYIQIIPKSHSSSKDIKRILFEILYDVEVEYWT